MNLGNSQNEISSSYFIEDWINSFNLLSNKNIEIPNTNKMLDYLILESRIGILINNWKKPISVKVINTSIHAIKNLGLNKIFIICTHVSEYAAQTIEKLDYPIEIIHPYGLTEIAMSLIIASKSQFTNQGQTI